MSQLIFRKALIEEVKNFGIANNLAVKFENKKFKGNEENTDIYLEFFFLPDIPRSVTVGNTGQNEATGEIQINIVANADSKRGDMEVAEVGANLTSLFNVGKVLTKEGLKVLIITSGIRAGFIDGANYVIPFNVEWKARFNK